MSKFFQDVFKGLSAPLKHVDSKYFYDETGDALFQQIMHCPEYYLTKCELEILSKQSRAIIAAILEHHPSFDVVELGAGDALKSAYFLRELMNTNVPFTYYPIDISANVISLLETDLPESIPDLQMHGLRGEYIEMLKKANTLSSRRKVILFLGSNVGNFSPEIAEQFFIEIRRHLSAGDMLLTGFDLKKDPRVILNAYNDKAGITRRFNLNLLNRINRELDADFNPSQFDHYPTYDPQTGACKSYLVSLQDQVVRIGEADFIFFKEGEPLSTEISQKYSICQIEKMGEQSGYKLLKNFYDSRNWFVDSLWKVG